MGLTEEILDDGIENYEKSENFTKKEKLALLYSELMASNPEKIDCNFHKKLGEFFSEEEIVELGVFIGFNIGYHTFFGTLDFYPMFSPDGKLVDLGSGGGVPSLILIDWFKDWDVVLIERKEKRAEFLSWATKQLNVEKRTQIICDEVENVARNPVFEGKIDIVTARSFAPPPITAECACRFLKIRGYLVVSEPPDNIDRWDNELLEETGLIPLKSNENKYGTFQSLELKQKPSDRLPRRPGITRKRPLW